MRRIVAQRQLSDIIDDEKPSFIANQAICLLQQSGLERSAIPNPSRDKMVKLIIADLASPQRHWLNALTVPWTNQSSDVGWTHLRPRLVP